VSAFPTRVHRRGNRRLQLALTSVLVLLLAAILVVRLVDDHAFTRSKKTIIGSGVAATQFRSLSAFGSIAVTGISNLIVRLGAPRSVVVSADNDLLNRITTRVQSHSLVIGNTPGYYSIKTPIRVQVTAPSVDPLRLEGDGDITAADINSRNLTLALMGLGTIHASGKATRLRVTISGAGDAQFRQLIAQRVTAVVTGDGGMLLTATNSLNATVTGAGSITYYGNPPHVATTVTGNGAITPG
jgi:Putative auto-transporter adhesin, head GIN domain